MDPDANLEELREIARLEEEGRFEFDREPLERAVELFKSLDEWITRGGALPAAWRR